MKVEEKFLEALTESFRIYRKLESIKKGKGARSTKKLRPLHKFFGEFLTNVWGDEFEIAYLGDNTKEKTVFGKYYPKDIDISVSRNNQVIFCLGIKFVTSNYKQNANNYFETMMGETANIQAASVPYAHFIVLRYKTPYYGKNETIPSKFETLNEEDLAKYLKLATDAKQAHRPYTIGIFVAEIDETRVEVKAYDMTKSFSEDFVKAFESNLSMRFFVEEVIRYKLAYMATIK